MMVEVPLLRILLAIPLLTLPQLCAQADQLLSASDGNFEWTGAVSRASAQPCVLRFRLKSGLGYRLQLSGVSAGRLDDPGRRSGTLAAPPLASTAPLRKFKLTANGPLLRLELDGKPAWEYSEKEAGVYSAGAVRLSGPVRDAAFKALPPSPLSFAERYGPAIGEAVPSFSATDQTGRQRDIASLRGPKGLWVLFFRSADW